MGNLIALPERQVSGVVFNENIEIGTDEKAVLKIMLADTNRIKVYLS